MLRVIEGEVPAKAQTGLKDSWKSRGYFLPCICHPEGDLTVTTVAADVWVPAHIVEITPLIADVVRLRLVCDAPFQFRPGQYLTLVWEGNVARSYSVASLPAEGYLELHIRLLPNGRMSEWLRSRAKAGDSVRVLGPSGDCFYVPGRPDQPLLLIGTGTGLAPLYGILRDALQHGHTGPIYLFHAALRAEDLYLHKELTQLSATEPHFEYVPSLLGTDGPIDQVVFRRMPKLAGFRAFLCGDPATVQALKKKLFLHGMDLGEIHADAFLPSPAPC